MNIFWLDLDPRKSAQYACDQHVVKMISEHTQLLLSQLLYHGHGVQEMKPIPPGKQLMIWLSEDFCNFVVLLELTVQYHAEYQRRFGPKDHEGWAKLIRAYDNVGGIKRIRQVYRARGDDKHPKVSVATIKASPWLYMTEPPQYLPEDLKVRTRGSVEQRIKQVVHAYRRAYKEDKSRFARYYHSRPPSFMIGHCFTR
jgi:hypothetical protein